MTKMTIKKFLCKARGWLLVRPIRWFFGKMLRGSYLRWKISHEDYWGWRFPNIHWWILYKTIFNFFSWVYWDGWRPFCNWDGGHRNTYPLIARIIHKIGSTTAGFAICGCECFHCASDNGSQVELSDDENGETFKLDRAWTEGTQDGTDHRFCGTTICPDCGYEAYYEDGSL